jgi:hypothetical protein
MAAKLPKSIPTLLELQAKLEEMVRMEDSCCGSWGCLIKVRVET